MLSKHHNVSQIWHTQCLAFKERKGQRQGPQSQIVCAQHLPQKQSTGQTRSKTGKFRHNTLDTLMLLWKVQKPLPLALLKEKGAMQVDEMRIGHSTFNLSRARISCLPRKLIQASTASCQEA